MAGENHRRRVPGSCLSNAAGPQPPIQRICVQAQHRFSGVIGSRSSLVGELRGALFGGHRIPLGNAVCRAEPYCCVVMLSASRIFVERFAREYASVRRDRGFLGASSTAGTARLRAAASQERER